jgi:hypothetical protein
MRGILFPNANILFDVQSKDPNLRQEAGGRHASSTFSGIYTRLAGTSRTGDRAQ